MLISIVTVLISYYRVDKSKGADKTFSSADKIKRRWIYIHLLLLFKKKEDDEMSTNVMNNGTIFMEDEISNDFGPYSRVAAKIDEVLSALTFSKMVGNAREIVRLNNELEQLRSELVKIKNRNRCH